MIDCNDLYDYGYKIYQNREYFKFSLDSILLAEFVDFKSSDRILDMCTGNIPIPLILTYRDKRARVDAVELQNEIYELAQMTLKENGLTNITLHNCDVKKAKLPYKYDVVICNPPYFKVESTSQMNDNRIKRLARHEVAITLEEVIMTAIKNLKENGKMYLVHRTDRFLETLDLLRTYSLGIRRIVFVFTKKNASAEFFLIEASKYKKNDPKIKYIDIENVKSYKNIFKEDDK